MANGEVKQVSPPGWMRILQFSAGLLVTSGALVVHEFTGWFRYLFALGVCLGPLMIADAVLRRVFLTKDALRERTCLGLSRQIRYSDIASLEELHDKSVRITSRAGSKLRIYRTTWAQEGFVSEVNAGIKRFGGNAVWPNSEMTDAGQTGDW